MVMNRDGYNLLLRYFPAGNLGLSWQQVRASHQIGQESFRKPGLGTAQVYFRNCTAILGLSWSRDPVSLLKIESLLTRISGGDWSAAARVALQHCRYMLLGIIRLRDKVPVYLWLHQARGYCSCAAKSAWIYGIIRSCGWYIIIWPVWSKRACLLNIQPMVT